MKYLTILFILLFSVSLTADIHNVPKREIDDIKYLFEDLAISHDFAYTLFGSKPMSLADYDLKAPSIFPIHKWIRSRYLFVKAKAGLRSWYKHRKEFDLKEFIFLDEETDLFECLVLVLINKKNMLHVLYEHQSIFKQKLGNSFTPELFLETLEKKEISLAKAIHDNDQLLGIMLGYGERNAMLFQERFDLMKAESKRKKENLPKDEELIKKLDIIESKLSDFSEFEEDAILPPIYFLADTSHPETLELKKKYENDRQQIEKLMKKPHFADRILERLMK